MSAVKPFVLGFCVAAAGAAAGWFLLVVPREADLAARAAKAEGEARQSGRDASDSRQWAETERDRNRNLEDRVKELETAVANAVEARRRAETAAAAGGPADGGKESPRKPDTKPEEWDRQRLNQEIESLAAAPDVIERSARFPLVVRALRARGAEGTTLVLQLVSQPFDAPMMTMCAALADALGDPRAVEPILKRWQTETDPICRRAMLRALANLPGDAQLPVLLDSWHDPAAETPMRKLALHGLALRGHEAARKVAETKSDPAKGAVAPMLRKTAVESLRTCAQRGGWADATLVPVFGRALLTADGPEQRKLALIALEGMWSKDAIPDLEQFVADPGSPEELVLRARTLLDGVRLAAPRPEGAGIPDRSLAGDEGGARQGERK